ncbi:hypothetical protein [Dethiothermospora halolimnae]
MEYNIIVAVIFLIIFITIQYTLNKILMELKNIKQILVQMKIKD